MNILTEQGKQIIREIGVIKYKKPFSKLTKIQQKKVVNIFINKFTKKGINIEKELMKLRG